MTGRRRGRQLQSPISEWDTGVSDPGALKLDHLHPVEPDFVPKNVHLFSHIPIINLFLLPLREEVRKERGQKIGKRESPKSEWDMWVSDPGAFKLDHLQPVKPFPSPKFSNFYIFVLWSPILSGCDRRDQTVPSVLNGQSVLFYH